MGGDGEVETTEGMEGVGGGMRRERGEEEWQQSTRARICPSGDRGRRREDWCFVSSQTAFRTPDLKALPG